MPSVSLVRLLPPVLSGLVALVSLQMAWKGLFAREWLPFHATAAGTAWRSLPPRMQSLLVFQVRMVGLGFLAQFLLLAVLPVYLAWRPDPFVGFAVLVVATIWCLGLGVLTRQLHRETGAATPWKKSFAAAIVLALSALLTIATR